MAKFLWVVRKEFRHLLPPVIFFAISFNLILFSMNLIMSDYIHRIGSFLLATMAALMVEGYSGSGHDAVPATLRQRASHPADPVQDPSSSWRG
jgi:hypothetical protein